MCCRYSVNEKVLAWLGQFRTCGNDTNRVKPGDIRPLDTAPVLVAGDHVPALTFMTWGMERQRKPVINARGETLWDKPMFRENVEHYRCVLPAACFYEWDRLKQKNIFRASGNAMLLLAGIYVPAEDRDRFVIITQAANALMQPVHDRMPVCLGMSRLHTWLFDRAASRELVGQCGVSLERHEPMSQIMLWDIANQKETGLCEDRT